MSRDQKYQICRFVFIFGLILIAFGIPMMFVVNMFVPICVVTVGVIACVLAVLKEEDTCRND